MVELLRTKRLSSVDQVYCFLLSGNSFGLKCALVIDYRV